MRLCLTRNGWLIVCRRAPQGTQVQTLHSCIMLHNVLPLTTATDEFLGRLCHTVPVKIQHDPARVAPSSILLYFDFHLLLEIGGAGACIDFSVPVE